MSETPEGAELVSFPKRDEDRLRLALRRLEEALEAQAKAMAGFRASMSDLSTAVGSLQNGVQAYQAKLGEVAGEVEKAHEAAVTLEKTADRWMN